MNNLENSLSTNWNPQRRPNNLYSSTTLRQYIRQKWLTTIIGFIGLMAGVYLIVDNEARAVQTSKLLSESISLVVPIEANAPVDKANIGKIIYINGVMTVHEPLTETDYGISVLAVKLLRQVQMYQWVETKYDIFDGEGNIVDSPSYSYYTDWQNDLIDSSLFHSSMSHWNPREFPIKRQTQINENVKLGNYYLGVDLKKKFKDFVPVTSDERPEKQEIKLHSGMYYHSQNIWKPEVGDVRIQFYYAGQHGQVVTIVAMLDDTLTLVPYPIRKNVNISFLRQGYYSLEDMFALVHSQNKFLTWILRGTGWLVLYVSCVALATFLQIMVSHSYLLQVILPVSHSSMKMTVSMCLSLFVTAVAWVWYRPVLGLGLIIVTMSLPFLIKYSSGTRYNRYIYSSL